MLGRRSNRLSIKVCAESAYGDDGDDARRLRENCDEKEEEEEKFSSGPSSARAISQSSSADWRLTSREENTKCHRKRNSIFHLVLMKTSYRLVARSELACKYHKKRKNISQVRRGRRFSFLATLSINSDVTSAVALRMIYFRRSAAKRGEGKTAKNKISTS